jgi:hypothetical protein
MLSKAQEANKPYLNQPPWMTFPQDSAIRLLPKYGFSHAVLKQKMKRK